MAKKINFDEFRFCQSGSKNLRYVHLILTRIFPSVNETEGLNFFSTLTSLIEKMETDKKYFWHAPLTNTIAELPSNLQSKSCVGTFLKANSCNNQLELLDNAEELLNLNTDSKKLAIKNLIIKLKKISQKTPNFLVKLPSQKIANFFYIAIYQDNSFFSKVSKYFNNIDATKVPPAYQSRIRDKIPIKLTPNQFANNYRELASYLLPANVHWTALEILNRTKLTPKLKSKNGHADSPNCVKCEEIGDNFHITNECVIPFMAHMALKNFLLIKYANLNFDIHNFSLFTPIEHASKSFNQQIIHMLINMQHLSYKIQFEPKFNHFSPLHFYAKIFTVINSTLWLRKYAKWDYNILEEFKEYYANQIDTFHVLLYPQNKSHFRESITLVATE